MTLKFDDNGSCKIHSFSDGDKEIVTNERYVVIPWKVVNVDGKRVSLKEAVDEIFSNQDELTNSTYVALELDDKGCCKIHSASDGDKEIVTNERYVVMPWKVVNVDGKRVSLKEAVDEIFSNQDELTNSTYVALELDDKGCCKIHSVSDGDKEIVTNERYVVMPWKVVNVDGKRVSLKEAVDEIFSNQDELTNSTYVALELDDKGCCKIHSVSDGDKEIVTNERYLVIPWKVVTRHGKNMTLKEAVDGIFSHHESEAKENERREREREEIEKNHKEYYETHMKEETGKIKHLGRLV